MVGKKYTIYGIIVAIFLIILTPYIFGINYSTVSFNQHYIEGVNKEYGAFSFGERASSWKSFYLYRVNSLFSKPSAPSDFDDAEALFSYVFSHIPRHAIVYPTEFYYYWLAELPDRTISGNLRLVELDNGKLGFGYFDTDEQDRFGHKLFSEADGLFIKKKDEGVWKVTYEGRSVYFHLPTISGDEPQKTQTLDEEVFVSKVRDESGVVLYLYFNNVSESFYYLLDEEAPLNEELRTLDGTVYMGDRTEFAYYYDSTMNRKVLFGVFAGNVAKNNYFDGPFDQVPPRLNLRPLIYRVYPYTQFGSGIDMYGNYIDVDSTRVAVSPYMKYYGPKDLFDVASACETLADGVHELYSCLTYEEKEDYHLDSPLFFENGTKKDFVNASIS